MKFVDKCVIELSAGNGGDGIVSWRREAHHSQGGPWGGDGGKGGDIFIISSNNENTLFNLRYKKQIIAPSGENGKSKLCHGANGEDVLIHVPVGSNIKDIETNEVIYDFTQSGESFRICKGGQGGHGNAYFKSSRNKAPKLFERGDKGEYKKILIELKHIADVGLLGLPNAGKSTFLKNISSAKPKVAPYKFTTLVPVLGNAYINETSIVFADIPGLIENASIGQGLGHEFLKHIERCHILIHLISLSDVDNEMEGRSIVDSYKIIRNEISKYNKDLLNKKIITVANKIDAEGAKEKLVELQKYINEEKIFVISAINKDFNILMDYIEEEYIKFRNSLNKETDILKIIKEKKNEKEEIHFEKISDTSWIVSSPKINYWFNKIPQSTEDNLIRLNQKIEIDKIEKILKDNGAKVGDIMIINDIEYILD